MGLNSLIITIMDPFGIIRKYLYKPAADFLYSMYMHYKEKTNESVNNVRDVMLRLGLIAFGVAVIVWTAVFMYITFYYAYMPVIAHMRPVHMQFKACETITGPCTFPSAHVSLTKKQQLLMIGQPYKVIVSIDMPESPQNQNVGMFMVCAEMRDQSTSLRGHSCRTAMLHYKSPLLNKIITWIQSPLFLMGFREEKQIIPVELFSSYEDDKSHPVTDMYVEIQSRQVQFYSVTLHITAHFTGLRYFMFHWPILSASIGISSNLFFILIICMLSWYHWSDTAWIEEAREKYNKLKEKVKTIDGENSSRKSTLEKDESTSIDESNNILDDDDLSIIEDIKNSSKSDDFDEFLSESEGIRRRTDAAEGFISEIESSY